MTNAEEVLESDGRHNWDSALDMVMVAMNKIGREKWVCMVVGGKEAKEYLSQRMQGSKSTARPRDSFVA